ncbi:MAG: hypothetical protein ABGX83_00170 [Nitrospira sp.]|nr:hypothetical protein [Candidatus Manganitrophaceae bacterium]
MPGKKLNKKELAYAKVMVDLGHSPTSVANSLGRSHHTVITHLQKECDDPAVAQMVELIKKSELNELHAIGFKSRAILNNYLDEILAGERQVNPIAVTAILDRTNNQKVTLQSNTPMIFDARANAAEAKATKGRIEALEAELKAAGVELIQDESGVYHAGED